jgi:hypothetical protein
MGTLMQYECEKEGERERPARRVWRPAEHIFVKGKKPEARRETPRPRKRRLLFSPVIPRARDGKLSLKSVRCWKIRHFIQAFELQKTARFPQTESK